MIVISTSTFNHTNPERNAAYTSAMDVLLTRKNQNPDLNVLSYNFPDESTPDRPGLTVHKTLTRDARTLFGAERRTPVLHEVLDQAATQGDLFGYVNADILVPQSTIDRLREENTATLLCRYDIEPCTTEEFEAGQTRVIDNNHPGFDGVFFTRNWWMKHRQVFPNDLLIGECAWDDTYNWLFYRVLPKHSRFRGLYHIKHQQVWSQQTRGGQHNLRILNAVCDACHKGLYAPLD